MRTLLHRLVLAFALPALTVSAQEAILTDPTTESPEIKSQLDTIRGVEEMGLLRKQVNELSALNQKLMEQLTAATQKIDAMQTEMNAIRQGQEDAARRWSALPELRLVAQVRTDVAKQADVSADGRTYRIVDGRPFRLVLANNEILSADPSFLEDGTIEINIQELDAVQLLAFRPAAPEPSSKVSTGSQDDED